jgi:hypothetical protein
VCERHENYVIGNRGAAEPIMGRVLLGDDSRDSDGKPKRAASLPG